MNGSVSGRPVAVPSHSAVADRALLATVPDGGTPTGATWFAITVMILSTGAFFAVFLDGSNPAVLGLWILAYAVGGAMLVDGLLRDRLTVLVPIPLLLFVGLAGTSVLWTSAADVTIRRSIGLAGTVIIGLVLAQRLRPVEILDAVRRAMLIIAVLSLLFYLSGDARAVDPTHDTMRGVVATKNTLGRVMGLGLLAAAATAFIDPQRTRRAIWSAVPMVAALLLTGSAGGGLIAVLVLFTLIGALLWKASAGRTFLVGAGALATGTAFLFSPATEADDIVGLVGRDLTLTGRTDIWGLSLDALAQQPFIGYGYGTFWHEAGPIQGRRIVALLYWPVPNAHNGLLDVALDVGLAGVVLAVLLVGGLLVRGVRETRRGQMDVGVLRLSIGLLVLVSNLAESSFLQENAFLTVVFVAALAAREPDPLRAASARPGLTA